MDGFFLCPGYVTRENLNVLARNLRQATLQKDVCEQIATWSQTLIVLAMLSRRRLNEQGEVGRRCAVTLWLDFVYLFCVVF